MEKILNYINGKLTAPQTENWLDNYEPASGKVYSLIPASDARDIEAATQAAKAASKDWGNTPAAERSRIMMRIAQLIDENLSELAAAESRDNGKPLKLATKVDIPRARDNFHFFATGILHFASEAHQMEDQVINYTLR